MGYEAATFQEIAARADLTRPAINHTSPANRLCTGMWSPSTNSVVIAAGIKQAEAEQTLAGRVNAFMGAAVRVRTATPRRLHFWRPRHWVPAPSN